MQLTALRRFVAGMRLGPGRERGDLVRGAPLSESTRCPNRFAYPGTALKLGFAERTRGSYRLPRPSGRRRGWPRCSGDRQDVLVIPDDRALEPALPDEPFALMAAMVALGVRDQRGLHESADWRPREAESGGGRGSA